MNFKELFKKYHKRRVIEGVLSAAMIGLAVGSLATAILAALSWCFGIGSLWLAIGVGVGVAAIIAAPLYILRYRPTDKSVARRIDRLGLEERAITMLELGESDSFLAQIQREDTLHSIKTIEGKKIKMLFSTLTTTLAAIAFVLAISMSTLLGLSEANVIPNGEELFGGGELADWVNISYEAADGGEILGDDQQLLPPGADTTPVVAIAHEGYMFLCWDDGVRTPERYERDVDEELSLIAIFIEVDIEDADLEEMTSQDESDISSNLPDEIPSGDMLPQNGAEGPPEQGESGNDPSDNSDPNGAGGKWNDANQFIDGNQYYRDQLDMYYELALEIFKDGGEIPPELREFFENYFDSI